MNMICIKKTSSLFYGLNWVSLGNNPLFTCFYDDGSVTLIGILSGLFRHLQLKCFILKRVFEPSSAFKRVEAGANTILDPSISAFCLTGEQA